MERRLEQMLYRSNLTWSLEIWYLKSSRKGHRGEESRRVKADVIYVATIFAFQELMDEGIIDKFPGLPELQYILDEYKDPNGYFVCGRLLVMVIVYNPNLVSDPPKSWEDLTKPEWKGKIVMANPLYSGSTQFTVTLLQ